MEGTLIDGGYIVQIVYFEGNNWDGVEMNVTIENGVVNGEADLWGDLWPVTGRVQGSSILLTMTDSADPAETSELIRIAGDVGLMGSVAGMYTRVGIGYADINSGMFVASFMPEGGFDPDGVANVVSSIYSGSKHIIFRDIFEEEYKLGWGELHINIDPTGTVTADDTTIWLDGGSDPDDVNFTHPNAAPMNLGFVQGELIETSDEIKTNIIYLEFYDSVNDRTLGLYQAVGSRRGIFVIEGDIFMTGDAYMATGEGLAPSLDVNTDYDIKVAAAHAGMLGQSRSAWIGPGANQMPYSSSFTTPALFDNTDPDFSGNLLKIYNGSLIAFKNDDDNSWLNNGFDNPDSNGEPDFIRLVELYETGALQGEEIMGGSVGELELENPLSYYPATFVGFVNKQGEGAPSASGTLNFLARVLYSAAVFSEGAGDGYMNAYMTGTLSFSESSATLSYTDPSGSSETASLTAENAEGLLHMHGALDDRTYLDIFWPVGGKKAVYITSNNTTGDGLIIEVGEAYLTR